MVIEENLPLFYGDGLRLEQIMSNLLDNAICYTTQGTIYMRINSREQKEIIITVNNTGPGISEEELPYIFECFYRVEKSRSQEHGGTGLGLAIVKQLAELYGRTIEVYSKAENGTCFKVRLPVLEGPGKGSGEEG
ncbi:sensor histidine kinase [Alkalicoccus saliphilus]|uniref:histidine kinase n=1 Tax=Alkalicoccus saliphilus TaxID=200989 RepID=A0A2T4U6R3_9BACI|nr:HAMP domain-containing sensor histidine kinase [Alkalicoccus saliphilus]PTL39086.1 hypothetical protein C6Y45_07860 [Alkalicoccus saliphilus]